MLQFARVPLTLTQHGPAVTHVYVCLARYADRDGLAVVSVERLAADGGVSERTVRRCLAELEADGYITKHKRSEHGLTVTNEYRLAPLTQDVQGSKRTVAAALPQEPAPDTSLVEPAPDRTASNKAGLIVARNWTTPTTQSKQTIAGHVARALADGFTEEQMAAAIKLLSDNRCNVNPFSLGEAVHGKVVNGPNAGKKPTVTLAADRQGQHETHPEGSVFHPDPSGVGGYWVEPW